MSCLFAGRTEQQTCTCSAASFSYNSVSRNTPDACGEFSISVCYLLRADKICKPCGLHESNSMCYRIGLLNKQTNSAASIVGGGLGIRYTMEKNKSNMTVNKKFKVAISL